MNHNIINREGQFFLIFIKNDLVLEVIRLYSVMYITSKNRICMNVR